MIAYNFFFFNFVEKNSLIVKIFPRVPTLASTACETDTVQRQLVQSAATRLFHLTGILWPSRLCSNIEDFVVSLLIHLLSCALLFLVCPFSAFLLVSIVYSSLSDRGSAALVTEVPN